MPDVLEDAIDLACDGDEELHQAVVSKQQRDRLLRTSSVLRGRLRVDACACGRMTVCAQVVTVQHVDEIDEVHQLDPVHQTLVSA